MMIGSNMVCNHQRSMDLHMQNLQHQMATVDRTEAEAGASQSDQVRLAAKRNEQDDQVVPYSTFQSRAVAFAGQLKSRKDQKTELPEESCPVAKARSQSEVGTNVPLDWLIADSYGGAADLGAFGPAVSAGSEDSVSESGSSATDSPSAADFSTAAAPIETSPESGGTLLGQEWLLSPLA